MLTQRFLDASDSAIAAKVEQYRALRAAAAVSFDDVLVEPVLERLLAILRPTAINADLAVAREARARRFAIPH